MRKISNGRAWEETRPTIRQLGPPVEIFEYLRARGKLPALNVVRGPSAAIRVALGRAWVTRQAEMVITMALEVSWWKRRVRALASLLT